MQKITEVMKLKELKKLNLGCVVINVDKKGKSFFTHSNKKKHLFVKLITLSKSVDFPLQMRLRLLLMMFFWLFVSEEVDQVELVYTKFVSLVRFEPVIQNLLPLGEVCDVKDEIFRLSSKEWKLAVEKDVVKLEKKGFRV